MTTNGPRYGPRWSEWVRSWRQQRQGTWSSSAAGGTERSSTNAPSTLAAAEARIAELERDAVDKARAWDAIAQKNARIAELEAALRETIHALYDTHGRQEACPICRQIAERAKATLQK